MIEVSVIIPAYNAANTVARTLESLLTQTYAAWEVIVVDDGSEDKTVAIVTHFAEKDDRIRIVSQPNQGVSAARNTGIGLARHAWLLFLDADDWILNHFLERMNQVVLSHDEIDAVDCGWVRVATDGTRLVEKYAPALEDLFPTLARYCPFAIHACIVRKSLVESVGGFDTSLRTCEDWDLWQRIARAGAIFGSVKEIMAFYQMRSGSLSKNADQFFDDAIRMLVQGHSSDSRVPQPKESYAEGLPMEELPGLKLHFASWIAGLLLGEGKDARYLLKNIHNERDSGLAPYLIANNLFESTIIPSNEPLDYWYTLWRDVEKNIWNFLIAFEAQSRAPQLAQRSVIILNHMILRHTKIPVPVTVGIFHAIRIEVTKEMADIHPPPLSERLYCVVEMEGVELGKIELPICDGFVPAWLLKDAIAAQYAWQILGRFFEHTIYQKKSTPDISYQDSSPTTVHDQIGWTVFLQQLWERPNWPMDRFYDADYHEDKDTLMLNAEDLSRIEISEEVPSIKMVASGLDVIITVGGMAVGTVHLQAQNNVISAQALRAAITTDSNFELCRVCVREALIGRLLNEPTSLRERLTQAAALQTNPHEMPPVSPGLKNLSATFPATAKTVVLGRRTGPIGGNASWRAVLPSAAASELIDMAHIVGEPVLHVPPEGAQPDRVLYVPEDITNQSVSLLSAESQQRLRNEEVSIYGRQYFESLFSRHSDPWKYTHPYEQTKYEFTLSLLPAGHIHAALEIACAEGHFTEQLAPKVKNLLAVDISQVALSRAAERCQHLNHTNFQHLDFIKDDLPGKFDLIVCSEVLYYIKKGKLKAIAQKFSEALHPGGYLLMAHAHQVIDEPDKPGFDWGLSFGAKVIGDTFATMSSLRLRKEIRTPLYRVQLFEKQERTLFSWVQRDKPEIKIVEQPTPVPPAVESSVRWHGSQSPYIVDQYAVVTDRLPILMYHRVAPTGAASLSRYRVTPEQFEAQLQYLKDCGYYSVDWNDWMQAMVTRKALPGSAIALTFDDGYLDFYQYAWPLLQKYGFTATVFLVADQVGQFNAWDKAYGEEVPLMGWEEIIQLKQQGIEFGSHSCTHAALTALTPVEIVREGAKSRAVLYQGLISPVRLFAYPYGDTDATVAHLIGACGYSLGFSCQPGLSTIQDDMLILPRIEVCGSDSLEGFVANISQ